jgi:hypothetical protein
MRERRNDAVPVRDQQGAESSSPSSLRRARLSCACGFSARYKEAAAAGLTGIFIILLQAENQPNLPALRAGLEASLQCLFPLLSLFFTLHSLFLTNALWDALRNEVMLFAFTINSYK